MKTLFLVRHAKSSWKFPELTDFDRPLNRRGQRDAPKMGDWLRQRSICPAMMVSSPAVRTRQTALALAEATGYASDIWYEEAVYEATPEELLTIIQATRDAVPDLMLVGHNPGLTELSNQLTTHHIENVVTAGIVNVRLPVARWSEVRFGMGEFGDYVTPKSIP